MKPRAIAPFPVSMPDWSEELAGRVEAFATAHHLPAPLRARWRALAADDAAALLEIAEELRLGENHLRDFCEWSEEVALRDATSVGAVLRSEGLRAARARDL